MAKNSINEELLSRISYLDAFSESRGELSAKAVTMTRDLSEQSIVECLKLIGETKRRIANKSESKIIINSVYEALLPFLGKIKFKELSLEQEVETSEEESFDELYGRLNNLVGLDSVKATVSDLMAYHRIQKIRAQAGLKIPNRTLHLAFLGNPGTGKTTVARIVGKMYKQLGLLSRGHFIEVSRTDLIAEYQGQTAHKVKQIIDKAKGGVLFIDEAYSLTENDHSDSYGRECLTELTKALEDYRKDLVVIVAGYTDLMKVFFESNPGLKSRFNTFIEFNDYSEDELAKIFIQMCKQDDYDISKEGIDLFTQIIVSGEIDNSKRQANGRFVRNLYEDIIMNHARRLNTLKEFTTNDLKYLSPEDIVPL